MISLVAGLPRLRGPACDGHPEPDLWFSNKGRAAMICGECVDREACLNGAIERGETYGVWGGVRFGRHGHDG